METAEQLRVQARVYRARAERANTVNEALSLNTMAASCERKAQAQEKAQGAVRAGDPSASGSS